MKSFWKVLASGLGVLALGVGIAFAGINPGNVGLPTVLPASMGLDGYANTISPIDNNKGSAMCVDCHGRNPSRHVTGAVNTRIGSHWVTKSFLDTGSSGGYPGDGGKASTNGRYLHRGPWSRTTADNNISSTLGLSKYGLISGTTVQPNLVPPTATSTVDNTYQIICESCHNIVRNVGDNKLLAVAGANWDNGTTNFYYGAVLCVGCHGDMSDGINNEAPYFAAAGNPQDHHVNDITQGLATEFYRGTGASNRTMNIIDNAFYTAARMWAVQPGMLSGLARSYAFTPAQDPGIKAAPITVTNGLAVGASGTLHCNNCHRPHNAVSSTGSLIIQAGRSGTPTDFTFGLLPVPATTGALDADGVMVRQRDKGSPKTFANKLIQDDNGLCAGCHANR